MSRLRVAHILLMCTYVEQRKADLFVCTALVEVNPLSLKPKGSARIGVASSSSVPAATVHVL